MFTKMHCQQFHVGMVFTRPMPWMCHTPQQGTCTVSYSVAHRSVARHPTEWTCWCLLVLAHTVVSEVRWHRPQDVLKRWVHNCTNKLGGLCHQTSETTAELSKRVGSK